MALTQEQKEALLTEKELREYRIYQRLNQPPMAQSTQARFYELFLNHQTCEEIHKLNPNGVSLGAVVRARIDYDWDDKKKNHQVTLMGSAREMVEQVTLETVRRITLELAASNKLATDKALKYLQTGEESELAGTGIGTLRHLKEMTEILQKLTGQDKKTEHRTVGEVTHTHTVVSQPETPSLPVLPKGEPVSQEVAASALETIYKNRGGK